MSTIDDRAKALRKKKEVRPGRDGKGNEGHGKGGLELPEIFLLTCFY